jgi:sugar phosphate isomerase/epimerase
MKPSISTLFSLHKPLREAIEDLQKISPKYIEVVDAGPHTLNPENVKLLNDYASTGEIKYSVHAPFTDVNISTYDDMIRNSILKRYEQSLKYSSEINADIVVFHPGNTTALLRATPGSAWEKNLESTCRLFQMGLEYGVRPMIENVPEPFEFVMRSLEDFHWFYKEVEVPIMMVLDVAHANIRDEVYEFISQFRDRIGHVHISDNQGDQDTHMPLGSGNVDWGRVVRELKAIEYNGNLVIESYSGVEKSYRYLETLL